MFGELKYEYPLVICLYDVVQRLYELKLRVHNGISIQYGQTLKCLDYLSFLVQYVPSQSSSPLFVGYLVWTAVYSLNIHTQTESRIGVSKTHLLEYYCPLSELFWHTSLVVSSKVSQHDGCEGICNLERAAFMFNCKKLRILHCESGIWI